MLTDLSQFRSMIFLQVLRQCHFGAQLLLPVAATECAEDLWPQFPCLCFCWLGARRDGRMFSQSCVGELLRERNIKMILKDTHVVT